MGRVIRLRQRINAGGRVWYPGDWVNLDKCPEVDAELQRLREERKAARAPKDKMQRPEGYKTK